MLRGKVGEGCEDPRLGWVVSDRARRGRGRLSFETVQSIEDKECRRVLESRQLADCVLRRDCSVLPKEWRRIETASESGLAAVVSWSGTIRNDWTEGLR